MCSLNDTWDWEGTYGSESGFQIALKLLFYYIMGQTIYICLTNSVLPILPNTLNGQGENGLQAYSNENSALSSVHLFHNHLPLSFRNKSH